MRPANLKTKIFLDGGDPKETKEIINLLGFLDGQTTNPTLISKNPDAVKRLEMGEKFTKEQLLVMYKSVVQEISSSIPKGSVSIQVYSDSNTLAKQMLDQGEEMYGWIPNAHFSKKNILPSEDCFLSKNSPTVYIKYPTTLEGLKAAEESVKLGMRVNMTLVFSQEQAAAIYNATRGAKKGQVIISPFIGRLDDLGINGMSLILNIIKMFEQGDGHIEILAASIRNMDHLLYSFKLNTDIVTLTSKTIKEWLDKGLNSIDKSFVYPKTNLKDLTYQELDLTKSWQEFNIQHDLTDKGLEKFASDWNALLR